jgi:hypothetical protein
MRIFLRFAAGYMFLTTLFTARLVAQFLKRGDLTLLLKSGPFGILTFAGWLITLVAGIPAAILLWRMRDLGRVTTAAVVGSIGLYYLLSVALFRTPQTAYAQILFNVVFSSVLVAILLSPAARRACH